mmetsp:Transcript_73628/g.209735  ORF Transcript_73628/g.209735 Transcript_73628/m.209735 type:complete len:221 (-) Transcript_73628:1593-2255(-)
MMRSQRYNPEQKDDTDFRYKLYEVHAGRTGSDEDDEYGGGWSKSPTRCEDEGGFHCHLFNLSLDLSLLFTLVVFACSIMGMVAVRVPRLQFWQGRVALFGGLSGLVAVFVFGGLFPIRKACVAFYKRIDDDDDGDDVYADDECDDPFTDDDCITTEHDTCSYGYARQRARYLRPSLNSRRAPRFLTLALSLSIHVLAEVGTGASGSRRSSSASARNNTSS